MKKSDLEEILEKELLPHWNLATEEAMKYSVLSGGKRIRPALLFAVGEDLKLEKEHLLDLAVAVEFFHTASLIHDDLPSIDNSDYRRGKLTCHRVFGEGTAILAGDGLFFRAFKIISKLGSLTLIREFSEMAYDLLIGEAMDVEFERRGHATEEEIEKMYEFKTGALFGFCFSAPLVLVGMNHEEMKRLGRIFGVAFQIYDDLKDLKGDAEKLGKDTGKDVNKMTLIKKIGIEESKRRADEYYGIVLAGLERMNFGKTKEFLVKIKSVIEER